MDEKNMNFNDNEGANTKDENLTDDAVKTENEQEITPEEKINKLVGGSSPPQL